jgi:hypothetical protein
MRLPETYFPGRISGAFVALPDRDDGPKVRACLNALRGQQEVAGYETQHPIEIV